MTKTCLTRRALLGSTAALALAPARTMAQSPDKVEVLLDWKALPTYAGFFLARELGAFERRGLEVSFGEVQGAIPATEAIGAGSRFWIGTSSGMATAIGRSRGQPVKSLAVYYRKTPTAIFSRAEDRIAHPRDLYGKRIGLVKGSITNDELRAMFALNKLDLGKVTQVPVEWDPYALLEKKVDALIDYEEMTPAELLAEGRRLLIMRLSDFGVKTYSLNLIVNEQAWASSEKRAIAQRVAEAALEGYSMVNERPGDAASHFARMFPRLAPRYIDRAMVSVAQQLGYPPIGGQTKAGWDDTIKLLASLDLLARPVTADDVAILG
jgi:ABC-type nitrate/sulfonate/bicarbonate transport system substrate-binding protein